MKCAPKADGHPLADGVAMVKACDQAGVRLFVVEQPLQQHPAACETAAAGRAFREAGNGGRERTGSGRVITTKTAGAHLGV